MDPIDLTLVPQTDPTEIYRYRDGIYASDILIVGVVWLDLFTWLSDHPSDFDSICRRFELAERPADVMLTAFAAMGLLTRANGTFELTTLAREHLVRGSPWNLVPYFASLKDRPVCQDLLKVLRTGKPANWGSFKDTQAWAQAMSEPAFAAQFTAAMDCRGVYLAQAVAKNLDCSRRKRLLDIGGGSGIYSCSLVAHHPHLTATVFEKPPVDRVCADAIARRGYATRVSVVAGDMFAEPLPEGFYLHLFSNVLHDWEEGQVRALLASSFRSLAPGGLLLVHDAHINAEKTGPLPVAEYSVQLMHVTEGKCYALGEMEAYLTEAGFVEMRHVLTAADRSLVTARKL